MKYESILKKCDRKLQYLNYAENTQGIYIHYISKFLEKVDKYPQHLTSNDFQSYLDTFNFSSVSQQNQVINAIRFLYKEVLGKKYAKVSFKRPRSEKHLPKVIDKEYLRECIQGIENLKHKSILMLAYSTGMRVSEVINLNIADIDSKRMIITIRQAKHKKDRIVPLSKDVLNLLRLYYKQYKPEVYMFNGQNTLKYSSGSCNKLVKKYIGSKYHFHMLRHSSFTAMLEAGTDLRVIQKIAGHKKSTTTEIYTHVSTEFLRAVQTPM